MYSLNDALDLTVSLRPRLVTLGRCHGTQERVATVLASQEDKDCAELPLPSYRSYHCFDHCGFCGERYCPSSRRQADKGMQDGGAW